MTNAPAAEADPPIARLLTEIGIVDQLMTTSLERALPDGLRASHFGVLMHFARRGGEETPAQLANAFQVTKAAMTNTLGTLEGRGFVRVRPHPSDGRAKLVSITDTGLAMRNAALAAVGPDMMKLQAALGEDAIARALPVLQRLREAADAARD